MADIVRKIVDCEVKEVGERTLQFIGSSETQDRDGEVIKASGWDLKNYKKNPVFLWAHQYDQPPIGKAINVQVQNDKLIFDIEFASKDTYAFADTIYKLYQEGFLKATSVGFMPDVDAVEDGEPSKGPKRTYTKQELLELSGVPVPSNPDALINARKAGLITTKDIERITKPETTENYHRIPIASEEGKHDGHKIRTIDIDKAKKIKALYCVDCKKVITYLFDVDEWSMAEARRWVNEHKAVGGDECIWETFVNTPTGIVYNAGTFTQNGNTLLNESVPDAPTPREYHRKQQTSQGWIADELDYVQHIITDANLNAENQKLAWDIASAVIKRLPGSDIPVDIMEKVGAVLSAKNKQNLKEAQSLIQTVIDSAEAQPEREAVRAISGDEWGRLIADSVLRQWGKH